MLLYDCIFPESIGGVEHRNYRLAKALAARGHEIVLAGVGSEDQETVPGIRVEQLIERGSLYTPSGRRSTREALRYANAVRGLDVRRFDVVETANIPYIHLWPLAHKCYRAGVPLIVTWHAYWGSYWRRYMGPLRYLPFTLLEQISARKGSIAVAVSQFVANWVEEHRSDPVSVIPNGVPLDEIQRLTISDRPDRFDLVYAGRLQREKRLDLALNAIAQLRQEGLTVTIDLIGDGPDQSRLQRLTSQLGIGDAVRFQGQVAEAQVVWRAIASARVALQPSEREGFGMFPLEAMACGTPVIYCQSTESAVSEIVRHGLEGIECRPTASALAEAIAALLDDAEGRRRLSTNARRRAERFDWPYIAQRFEQLCLRVRAESDGNVA